MRRTIAACTLVVAFLWTSSALPVNASEWQPLGLQGTNIWALERSPTGVLLAGSEFGIDNNVYRSLDGGASWIPSAGLPGAGIWDLEFDPQNENVVYAGLGGAGIWMSLDGAVNWSAVYPIGGVWEISVCKAVPTVVLAASDSEGVLKSEDGGTTWQVLGVVDLATTVAVHPSDPSVALVGSPFQGIWGTIDGGLTWVEKNGGFDAPLDIRSLLYDPHDPSIVYAGEMWGGVFKSVDGGTTWFKPAPDLFATVENITYLDGELHINNTFDDDGIPVFRSTDAGATWEPLPAQSSIVGNLWPRALEVGPGFVLIGSEQDPGPGGVFIWFEEPAVPYGPENQPLEFVRRRGRPKWERVQWESRGGPGFLDITGDGIRWAWIVLNGTAVASPLDSLPPIDGISLSVELEEGTNTIWLQLRGMPGNRLWLEFRE